jgi:hypothetical protein
LVTANWIDVGQFSPTELKDRCVLDENLYSKAMSLQEGIRLNPGICDLEEAILVALAIREKHCLGDSWFSIRKDLLGNNLDNWQSVLTCLYSIVSDPIKYLGECVANLNPADNSLHILNIILSNPIDEDQQVSILSRLLLVGFTHNPLSTLEIFDFIQHLSLVRPSRVLLSKNIIDKRK